MKLRFTKNQWERISEISGGGGLLSIGSIVIPFLLNEPSSPGVTRGLVIAIFCGILVCIQQGNIQHDNN